MQPNNKKNSKNAAEKKGGSEHSDKEKQQPPQGDPMEDLLRSLLGGFGGNFQKLPPNFSECASMWKSANETHSGVTS